MAGEPCGVLCSNTSLLLSPRSQISYTQAWWQAVLSIQVALNKLRAAMWLL